ncbi:MAG: 50S ribosomal protein L5 [Deltaproteobacteria bacterium]|jgi:large subunit ribosomal protein L5|nr:50S ribosomal protein L5 [Deltaproteobacteria bacterium]MDG2066071.1 50S ribosomal protein L5 [SAR324 cluster bacterium]HJL63637.1 50S ribosomal protein L5 [Candidatus Neomarinimicrobiota bacterium]MAF55118.1 50S ribosomal protein L5 [Deltaproteobacteria bacterium]MDP6307756.1 50S ribosomal protein L5 [SAR324 cluster bacterium]|tara:strand:+ start:1456 stop:2001 length:546 start_codon:yes stop_codon:yes gene_type:complete
MADSHLLQTYNSEVVPQLQKKFNYKNTHQIPAIRKVTLNIGLGEAVQNPKVVEAASKQLALIAGQKPVITRAKKSIAGFKLREGMPIGCMVTLRNQQMWNFLDKLLHVAMPRIRDFRGISPKAFDGAGNYTIGIKEQLIFPEIEFDDVDHVRGMNISIVTSAPTDEESLAMLQDLGFPFRK